MEKLAKWSDEEQRYVPVEDALEAFRLAALCVYPVNQQSHPVRYVTQANARHETVPVSTNPRDE